MDFSKLPLFSAMTRRMSWLGQRQQVLAQNIANVDTPGYTAQDLKEPNFNDLLRGASPSGSGIAGGAVGTGGMSGGHLTMVTTSPGHIGGANPAKPVAEKAPDSERKTSGNTVVLEDQMMKVSKTAMDFQLATNLYRKHLNMIKTALGRGGAS
jgi:flagellar basal-body rod protein FlgB